ncbi:unnamed protein product [Owenia fusiformis]|uniref:Uncharacterized protein n=1 Tax=Owenia fusiformis TaxID=6347 RepID=A0A8J1TBR4_OWEFU|nr:unnamed protein product [Owenia fusiformis]
MRNRTRMYGGVTMVIFCTFMLLQATVSGHDSEEDDIKEDKHKPHINKKVSQCFRTKGNPFITIYCGLNSMVKIHKAIHGMHNENTTVCHPLENDCEEDVLNSIHYDWSHCMGSSHCVSSVGHSWLADCGNYSSYLEVEYECVPKKEVFDICEKFESTLTGHGYLKSPNYPKHYPIQQDCECYLKTDKKTQLTVTFFDLTLEMKNRNQCTDWLLLQSGDYDGKHKDLNCGQITMEEKKVTTDKNDLVVHLHTDRYANKTQTFEFKTSRKLKGFWLQFEAENNADIKIKCGKAETKQLQSLKPNIPKPDGSKDKSPYTLGGASSIGQSLAVISLLSLTWPLLIRL